MTISSRNRCTICVTGTVQGVGFRPFVYRLAQERALAGWVLNDARGVQIEIEGPRVALDDFLVALRNELPPLARIDSLDCVLTASQGDRGFVIRSSEHSAHRTAQVSPDCHVCRDCLTELFDPADRRFRYPFINCTNCGPRYSIITGVPYDRPLTTMVDFPMCADCLAEYQDPRSRRFHAQPNACPKCGPALRLYNAEGQAVLNEDPLTAALACLRRGEILALKGLGGFHLVVDPGNPQAVARLRRRKRRDEKPFALMVNHLQSARELVYLNSIEARLLTAVERPIVLLEKRPGTTLVCPEVAPGNRYLGLMLPYTPLHHLLLEDFPRLVMTSGNQTDEPIAFDDDEALARLRGIADLFLCHNRRIHMRSDDSIVRVLAEQPLMLRRSRGYVPRAIKLPGPQGEVLALGAELKNTICLTKGDYATLSQHIGDLQNPAVVDSMLHTVEHLQQLLDVRPALVVHDLHPDYASTHAAGQMTGLPGLAVQHHHAHLASCLADNGRNARALGVIFDGLGYGTDGHIWGGEFLVGDYAGFERVGHLRELRMPGGDAATREPWRMGLSLLHATYGAQLPALAVFETIPAADRHLLVQMLAKGINAPWTSSCGRLFDAVAALVGLHLRISYEGQAALALEMCRDDDETVAPYDLSLLTTEQGIVVDPAPMVRQLVADLQQGRAVGQISAAFHHGLSEAIVAVCCAIRTRQGPLPVALSGGVFQNASLSSRTRLGLEIAGFEVLVHRQVPPNDGGLALGQAVIGGHYLPGA
jgi:hydrogenase maturation protein HypF